MKGVDDKHVLRAVRKGDRTWFCKANRPDYQLCSRSALLTMNKLMLLCIWLCASKVVMPQYSRMKPYCRWGLLRFATYRSMKSNAFTIAQHLRHSELIKNQTNHCFRKLTPKMTSFLSFQVTVASGSSVAEVTTHKYTELLCHEWDTTSLRNNTVHGTRRISHMTWVYLLLLAEIWGSAHILLQDLTEKAFGFANLISGKKVFL